VQLSEEKKGDKLMYPRIVSDYQITYIMATPTPTATATSTTPYLLMFLMNSDE
jgi:hypothetical protein